MLNCPVPVGSTMVIEVVSKLVELHFTVTLVSVAAVECIT